MRKCFLQQGEGLWGSGWWCSRKRAWVHRLRDKAHVCRNMGGRCGVQARATLRPPTYRINLRASAHGARATEGVWVEERLESGSGQ